MTRNRMAAAVAAGSVLLASAAALPANAATTRTVAVYYVGDTGTRAALYREFRQITTSVGPIRTAVDAMLHLPARDPDYKSLWPRITTIRGISVRNGVATVDLSSAAANGQAGSEFACASLQQLVYTVTAAAPTVSRVSLRINGRSTGVVSGFWGAGCGRDVPMGRTPAQNILPPVQISNVLHAQFVNRALTVTGEATVFEATVSWKVTDQATRRVIRSGFTTASIGAPGRGAWRFSVTLPPAQSGRPIVVSAWESSANDGSVTNLDNKALRVR